ncbi:MAG: carboxypeptidase-like regulatory domain-containing protein [Muribaculaceae bacterium]|nr:carboxypeptidase-like regulatory domain-containing protein [Muribaculaceae bacterium]
MKKILFCFISLLALTSCSKTDVDIFATLHGVVCDFETGDPIAGCSVVLSPSGATKITGNDGYFEFRDITAQQYTVTAQKTGYATNRKSINATSGENTELNITLSKQNH